MTLQVAFENFPATVKRLIGKDEAYVRAQPDGAIVTAANLEGGIVVASKTSFSADVASSSLHDLGFKIFEGIWIDEESCLSGDQQSDVYIAAVSYKTSEEKPGVWVDAYAELPTQVTVLRAIYEDFRSTGELEDIAFEEFVQLSAANVVVVSPSEIQSYLRQKEEC